jgi:hypothetical protein
MNNKLSVPRFLHKKKREKNMKELITFIDGSPLAKSSSNEGLISTFYIILT